MVNMKLLLIFGVSVILYFSCIVGSEIKIIEKSTDNVKEYDPNWESLDQRPLPDWYDQAKVGIFIHWGVYSVPSYGSEWFWTNWRTTKAKGYVDYMTNNYPPNFTYQEFARDFTAEFFNATEWAKLFEASGAKYVVLTSKHHDGFALWPSKYSFSWNSVDVGPHRDIVGELAAAIRKNTDLRFGLYHSLYEWYNPLYLRDKETRFLTNDFVQIKILPELQELIQIYLPEILWSDGEWEASYTYWNSTDFLAWLYNDSPVRNTIVTNDRWGKETVCKHGDFYTCSDRYNPGTLQSHKWENAMTIDRYSWGHRGNAHLKDFLSSKELIDQLVVTVSCGGNILINVGPSKTGMIEPIFEERLRDMGKWLKVNGEAIYETVPWKYQNDSVAPGVWYTATKSYKDHSNTGGYSIYAIALDYPWIENSIRLFSLFGHFTSEPIFTMLGLNLTLDWSKGTRSINVIFPNKILIDKAGLGLAWVIKIDVPQK